MKKDFLTFEDISRSEIFKILELAEHLKKKPYGRHLKNKTIAFFFENPSDWSRITFETGIKQLEGNIIFLDEKITDQLFHDGSVGGTARVLNRYADAVITRVFSHETLKIMAKNTDIPVINALSDLTHPCQVLSDLLTIKEKFGSFEDMKLAYIGDGNNVCNSLLLGCSKVGMNINVACPKEYQPKTEIIHRAVDFTKITKSDVNIMEDPVEAVKDANIVYNDTFVSMWNEKEREKRLSIFLPEYQVTKKLLNYAASNALYMHCLPAKKDEEVAYDVIDGPRSIVWDQAENRLHAQKALLVKMMGKKTFR